MRLLLISVFVANVAFSADVGECIAKKLDLVPSSKNIKRWTKVFSKTKKMRRYGIDKLSKDEKKALKDYLISHASNSKNPVTEKMLLNITGCKTSIEDNNEEVNNSTKTEIGYVQNLKVRKNRMIQEYKLVNALVSSVNFESVDSGKWSSPSTWKNGKIPSDGARVWIHSGDKIVINKELDTHIHTIKLDGELSFNPHKNTRLYVDTVVTSSDSILRIGEPTHPIKPNKTAQIIISDYNEEGMVTDNPQSPDYDPLRIGQGILTNGLFFAHGAEKTPYVTIKGKGVAKGTQEITFDEVPEGWRVEDTVVILGTSPNGIEAEKRTITAIDEDTIYIDNPLKYDHFIPETNITDNRLHVHVANLSRNIIIKSDPDILAKYGDKNSPENVEHRGHVLFMHNNNVNLKYVSFVDLGRTNKKFPLNETKFESDSVDAKATYIGTNQAARYPVHFHRAGLDGKIGRIEGCVVDSSPGWGYVNHSSNVIMKENIAYGVYGASFITEAGDENGVFRANMAIATRGYGASSVKGWKSRSQYYGDGGFQGNGFWIIGSHVDFVDNIVNGSSNSAFAVKHNPIDSVTGVVYSEDNSEHPYTHVGFKSFSGNIAYGNSGGVFGILSGTRNKSTEYIDGLLAWNNSAIKGDGWISWWYPDNVVLDNIKLINDIHNPKDLGIGTQTKLRKTILKNIQIEGFNVGFRIPEYTGLNIVENAYLNNIVNMLYYAGTTNKGANTRIQGDIRYGKLPNDINQTDIKFGLKVRDVSWKNYQDRQYNRYNIIYAPNGQTPMKLYMTEEQSPNFVVKVGSQKGKTNAQLLQEGHNPVGGVLVPQNAIKIPNMTNVSGVPVE